MKGNDSRMTGRLRASGTTARARRCSWRVLALGVLVVGMIGGPVTQAHSPLVDADLSDWCIGAFSNTASGGGRIEDSSAELVCGQCSISTNLACEVGTDCPAGESCINLTSKDEIAWWDNRTDGAVNDLGTVAMTWDNNNLYVAAELWVDPDPVSLPFGEIALDTEPGGNDTWHDPLGLLGAPGHCSVSTDRACTIDDDCHFCAVSTEPSPSTRVRTCGSGCNPDIVEDVCLMDETCVNLGVPGASQNVGTNSNPNSLPDWLMVFDFSRWLVGLTDSALLMRNVEGTWTPVGAFEPAVNPGASGGSGGPPGSVEVAFPWSAFGCTGCPDACECPGFGPGEEFRYTMIIARGTLSLDYVPDGAIEDTMSETVAGVTTTSPNSCPGFGIGNTSCELADRSSDAFIPPGEPTAIPGGRIEDLVAGREADDSITLSWAPSCSTADNDYEVYEGDLGTWDSHVPVADLCTTGGATTANFRPGGGSHYYLVVPSDGATEGSYGEDSSAVERPASSAQCRPRVLGICP